MAPNRNIKADGPVERQGPFSSQGPYLSSLISLDTEATYGHDVQNYFSYGKKTVFCTHASIKSQNKKVRPLSHKFKNKKKKKKLTNIFANLKTSWDIFFF